MNCCCAGTFYFGNPAIKRPTNWLYLSFARTYIYICISFLLYIYKVCCGLACAFNLWILNSKLLPPHTTSEGTHTHTPNHEFTTALLCTSPTILKTHCTVLFTHSLTANSAASFDCNSGLCSTMLSLALYLFDWIPNATHWLSKQLSATIVKPVGKFTYLHIVHTYICIQPNNAINCTYIALELKSKTKRNYNNKIANIREYKHVHTLRRTCVHGAWKYFYTSRTSRETDFEREMQ